MPHARHAMRSIWAVCPLHLPVEKFRRLNQSFGAIHEGGIYIPVRGWGDEPAERGIKIKPMMVSGVLERTEWLELLRNMVAAEEIELRVVEEYAPTKAADAQRALACSLGSRSWWSTDSTKLLLLPPIYEQERVGPDSKLSVHVATAQ